MKILALGAHPDDIEIFMFGFLSLCKKRGDVIHLAVATDGAAGNVDRSNNLVKIRKLETIKGLSSLAKPSFLNLPDGKLEFSSNAGYIINNYIKKIKPDLVLTHSPEDYHPDHRALSILVSNVVGFLCPVIFVDTLMGVNFVPEIYVDITDFFNEKLKAIACHKSQTPQKFMSAVTLWNGFRSGQCNGPVHSYAESFRIDKKFPFSDIRYLIPQGPKYRPFYSKNSDGLI